MCGRRIHLSASATALSSRSPTWYVTVFMSNLSQSVGQLLRGCSLPAQLHNGSDSEREDGSCTESQCIADERRLAPGEMGKIDLYLMSCLPCLVCLLSASSQALPDFGV